MKKDYRIKKNGESIQCFDKEGYFGSISVTDLCQIVRNRQKPGTEFGLAQNLVKESSKKG